MADIFELFRKISKKEEPVGKPDYILAGLGNPGGQYAATRHNAGFMAVDRVCADLGTDCRRSRFSALCGRAEIGGHSVLIMKPQTYMNLSGNAVRDAAQYYNIPVSRIIVISDDVNLDLGRMRIRSGGSDGGQKGLYDIIYKLSDDAFPRIRIGVGKKPEGYDMKDWVLSRFTKSDYETMEPCLGACADAVRLIIEGKTDEAMGKYNGMRPHTD